MLHDHIRELQAELRHCHLTRRERTAAETELAQAIARRGGSRPRLRQAVRHAAAAPPRCSRSASGTLIVRSFDPTGAAFVERRARHPAT